MEFEGLLLRKIALNASDPLKVLDSCIQQVRRCFRDIAGDIPADDIEELVVEKIHEAIHNNHVFENPKKSAQTIAYAEVWGVPCWFILSEEKDGGLRLVITMRMHKDKDFGDELAQIEEDSDEAP